MDNDATALPYDYVIGSVHRVDNEEVDRATDQRIYDRYETYELYTAYYANVRKAALSGRFEILGHPDLIKIFRHFPTRDITPILEETADAVAESGVAVDVNAAGLRKPIGEVYPAGDSSKCSTGEASLSSFPRMRTPRIRSHWATIRASRSSTRSATARSPPSETTSGGLYHYESISASQHACFAGLSAFQPVRSA